MHTKNGAFKIKSKNDGIFLLMIIYYNEKSNGDSFSDNCYVLIATAPS
jgi:hypothetical protein